MIIYTEIDYDHLKKDRAISEDVNYSPHFHQKYELLYVINIGDLAYFNLGAAKYSVRTGDIILIKPGVLHNLQIPSDTAYDRIVMYRLDRARTATKVRTKTETESETRRGDSNRNKDRNDKYRGQKQG